MYSPSLALCAQPHVFTKTDPTPGMLSPEARSGQRYVLSALGRTLPPLVLFRDGL